MTDPRNIIKSTGAANFDEVVKVTYENARDELRGPSPRWDVSHGGPAEHLSVHDVKLLRGRVLVKLLPEVESTLVLIDTRQAREAVMHRGVVVAMGEPALDKKQRPIPPGFAIGDTVAFLAQHKSRDVELSETYVALAQKEIEGVIE